MKLKYVVGSPNYRKVHAVIDHLGADVEFEYLDFFTGGLRTEGYTALDPNAMVPTLIDGDLTLWESNPGINAFYDRLADDPHWVATAPRDRQAVGRRPA